MKTSKKIFHLITSLGNGGAEKNLVRLCLLDKKNKNIVITLKQNDFYLRILKQHGILVINLNFLSNPIIALIKLISIIKNQKPNVIMGWMYHSCFLISLISIFIDHRIKKIWNIRHSSLILFKTKFLTLVLVRLILVIFNNLADVIVFNSFHSRKVHISYGFRNKKNYVIHNGYKRQKFRKKNINTKLKLGFIGRYSPQKNFKFLFKIISFLKNKKLDFKFYLIGSNLNTRNKELINHIVKNDIKDKIIFLKTKTDIFNYFNLFDVTISTSVYGESFPNILAESLLASTPCIASNFGENKLILKKGGLTYQKNNLNDFYLKLIKILDLKKNKKNWTNFRKEGYHHIINEFSDKKMLAKYLQIY